MPEEVLNPPAPAASPDFDGVTGEEADILNKESETPPEEVEDDTPELETEEEKPEEEDPLEEKADESKPGTPPFNALRKEHPDIFKKYPQIQANYFQAEQFKEYFPTIDDAKEAAQKSEIFDYFDSSVTKGDLNLVVEAINQNDPGALNNVADTILPILQSKNPQLYVRAIKPVIVNMLQYANALGDRHTDKEYGANVKAAVTVLANIIFGESGIPTSAAPQPQPDPEKQKLQEAHSALVTQQLSNFQNETYRTTASALKAEIETNLDPNQKLTKFTRDKLIETIFTDVNERLAKDPNTQKLMQSLWNNAPKSGLGENAKLQLKRAFLGRAKLIIPQIRSKRFAEALGNAPREKTKTTVPQQSGPSRPKSNKVSREEVKSKHMSEMDIIMYGAK